jgi:acetyl-CoA acetyltransferase
MDSSDHRPTSVVVLGCAETGVSEDPRSIPEMVLASVEGALVDAGLDWGDLDAAVTASVDLFDGLTASSIAVTEVVGGVMRPETRIAADGLAAAIHAFHLIRAEVYETVLVVAHGKASMTPHWDLTSWALDPIFVQPLGADFLTIAGLQAGLISGGEEEMTRRWAELSASRRAQGGMAGPVGVDEVLASPFIAAPIHAEMCAPLVDGACAVVLGSPREADRVMITGVGHDLDVHHPGDRDLTEWTGLRRACAQAYEMAGIDHPEDAFSTAEPSCFFPHEEALFVEATGIGGDTILSPGGGLFSGTAPVVAGLSRLMRAARGVEGRPGERALAHGTWGPAGQGHAVMVVEGG